MCDFLYPGRHLGSQLCELEKLIDKMMVEDFSMYARSELSRNLRDDTQLLEKVCFGMTKQIHNAQFNSNIEDSPASDV